MALSENLFPKLTRTFRKRRGKMDVFVFESIYISVKVDDNSQFSPREEVHVNVDKKTRLIYIKYVHRVKVLERNRYIRFGDIQRIRNPTIDTVMLDLEDGTKVSFIFGTQAAKDDFYEAITVVRHLVRDSDPLMARGCNEACLEGLLCSIKAVEAADPIKCQQS